MTKTQRLKHILAAQCPDVLLLKQQTQSTNDDVIQLVKQFPDINSVLICSETQLQGRGQHQRCWVSPQGNLYFSCLAHLSVPLDGRFALEVALTILNSSTLNQYPLSIKWTNDLYSEQGKWGGILIEPIQPQCVVVGVGINLYPLTIEQRQEIDQSVTSLTELNIAFDEVQFIADIYLAVQEAVQWFNFGSYNLAQRFKRHAYLLDQEIQFEHSQGIAQGRFLGIQNDGALILQQQQDSIVSEHLFYQGRIKL